MRRFVLFAFLLVSAVYLISCSSENACYSETKNISSPNDIANFYKVSEDLYRGAQPESAEFKELKKYGIKTIVNLRSNPDENESKETDFNYEQIPMKAWHVDDEKVVRFLKIATDANLTPVFVHCHRGADRTGVMVAAYRVVVQKWSKEDAINEMTKGGYGFYSIWQNLVNYIRKLDVEKIRQQAGIETAL